MRLSDFEYDLPRKLIAQFPLQDRAGARMMIVDRKTKEISHSVFHQLGDFLNRDDVLVLNNTRVFKARLFAQKESGGKVEILLVKPSGRNEWEAMVSHAKRLKQGARLLLDKYTYATIEEKRGGARITVRFSEDSAQIINKFGMIPLPQYIRRYPVPDDEVQYQTTFAKTTGSIAAPTAGLHFTDRLLDEIKTRGVVVSETTLHIGPGTFKPIRDEHVEQHTMDAEFFEIPEASVSRIKKARKVIAVGTSVCRTLETYARTGETNGWAHLFIYPGFEFRIVGNLLTNFHLPCSTPLLLVSAFAGRELILKAYKEAIRHNYRFLSYGDAMLII